jgi:phosphosulfolactate phosphohydrolase-like enzyme
LGKGVIEAVLPNIGAEAAKMANLNRRVVVACTDTGGVAYDAAFQECKWVTTGTVARSLKQKGVQPALSAARRAVELAKTNLADGIAVVAASRNSMEDILAAQFIANLIMRDDNV